MKKFLLAGAVSFALASAPSAHAMFGVGDVVFDPTSFGELVNQARQIGQQIQLAQQQVQQVMGVYNAISGVRDLGSALQAAGMLGLTSDLPINPYAVQGLLSGNQSLSGIGSSVGSLFNGNYGRNHVYNCTGDSYNCQSMQRNATSIAGIQSLSGQLYQEMANRLPLLQQLKARLDRATDLQDIAYVSGQINAQQTQINALNTQAQTLAMMQVSAYQSTQQQREERRHMEIDQVRAANPDRIQ